MKRVFFDTNVYNHVGPSEVTHLKQLISDGNIEILTTPQILAELAGTFKSNKKRGIKLCKIYGDLISKNVLQPPPILLRTEIGFLLDDQARVVYLRGKNKSEFFEVLDQLQNGKVDDNTQQFIEKIATLKKEQFSGSKLGYSKMEPYIVKNPLKKYPTFKSFVEEGIRRGERLKGIETYLVADLGSNAHKAAKFIEKRLHKTPHLAIALRIVPALTYYYHVQKNKPKYGDMFDCGYFVCLAPVDSFVSDDQEALDLFKFVCPNKEALSLSDLLSM